MVFQMAKTLVIAEKPSVGRDLSTALDGVFQRRTLEDVAPKRSRKKTAEEAVDEATTKPARGRARDEGHFLESDDYVITWAVGHLVQLADPEEYDETRIFGELARAEQIVAKVTGKDGAVESVERKEQSERAPLLYDLTSLQRDANRRFGFSARRTLQ